jgi:mono/diheme cytochrome c family protein
VWGVSLCVLATAFPLSADEERALREVSNPLFAIRDRCMTCHASDGEAGVPASGPVAERFHTQSLLRAHPVEELGCAACHGGNALAIEKEEAHALGESGGPPLRTGLLTQSRCIRCHDDTELPGTEFLQEGLHLIDDRACFACHEMPGEERRERLAPTLGNIASKVNQDWLVSWLMDPSAYFESARMPSFYLTERQARAIASYLWSTSEPAPMAGRAELAQDREVDRVEARRLLKKSACLDCHRMRGTGGSPGIRAPDLSHIGDKVQLAWLVAWLQGPQHLQPGAGMPAFRFTEAEATNLARYLSQTLTSRRRDDAVAPPQPIVDPELTQEGKWLVSGLGCMSCHGAAGEKPAVKMGPDLRRIGDRDVRGLYWPSMGQDWNMPLSSYLRVKISTPRAFGDDHIMPNFRFTADEVEAIVVALMSFAENTVPVESRLRRPEEPALRAPTGPVAAVFERYQCLQCHAVRGRFGTLAPDLGWEGDKANREWLSSYLKNPYPIRPGLSARMPNFGMTDEEIRLVVDYIEETWWDEEVPPDPFAGKPAPRELVETGQELFFEGYGCLDCHQVGEEGEVDGPALSDVGSRLQPGWLYQWVLDPQRFYENDMDDQGVTEEDALALTAYMTTLTGAGE